MKQNPKLTTNFVVSFKIYYYGSCVLAGGQSSFKVVYSCSFLHDWSCQCWVGTINCRNNTNKRRVAGLGLFLFSPLPFLFEGLRWGRSRAGCCISVVAVVFHAVLSSAGCFHDEGLMLHLFMLFLHTSLNLSFGLPVAIAPDHLTVQYLFGNMAVVHTSDISKPSKPTFAQDQNISSKNSWTTQSSLRNTLRICQLVVAAHFVAFVSSAGTPGCMFGGFAAGPRACKWQNTWTVTQHCICRPYEFIPYILVHVMKPSKWASPSVCFEQPKENIYDFVQKWAPTIS